MKAAIIYSTVNKHIRRLVFQHHVGENLALHVEPGESMVLVDAHKLDAAHPEIAFKAALGFEPGDPTCAIVDEQGNTIGLTRADPLLDTHPLGKLSQEPAHIKAFR